MRKPIEETWSATPGMHNGSLVVHIDNEDGINIAHVLEARNNKRRARLAACAPEMARMLLSLEWSGEGDGSDDHCLSCRKAKWIDREHASDCAWLGLMRKAGIR